MKSFTVLAIAALVIAFIGILSQHGKANWISGLSVVPLAAFVVAAIFSAFIAPRR